MISALGRHGPRKKLLSRSDLGEVVTHLGVPSLLLASARSKPNTVIHWSSLLTQLCENRACTDNVNLEPGCMIKLELIVLLKYDRSGILSPLEFVSYTSNRVGLIVRRKVFFCIGKKQSLHSQALRVGARNNSFVLRM